MNILEKVLRIQHLLIVVVILIPLYALFVEIALIIALILMFGSENLSLIFANKR